MLKVLYQTVLEFPLLQTFIWTLCWYHWHSDLVSGEPTFVQNCQLLYLHHFTTVFNTNLEVHGWLLGFSPDSHCKGINNLTIPWQKWVNNQGNYTEKIVQIHTLSLSMITVQLRVPTQNLPCLLATPPSKKESELNLILCNRLTLIHFLWSLNLMSIQSFSYFWAQNLHIVKTWGSSQCGAWNNKTRASSLFAWNSHYCKFTVL
jgi:hypothetical protein